MWEKRMSWVRRIWEGKRLGTALMDATINEILREFATLRGKTKSKIYIEGNQIIIFPSKKVLREHGGYDDWAYPVRWLFEIEDGDLIFYGAEWDEQKGGYTTLESYGVGGYPDSIKIAKEILNLLKKEARG
jgi:hypothetical protein